jgi:hypothetical protein
MNGYQIVPIYLRVRNTIQPRLLRLIEIYALLGY